MLSTRSDSTVALPVLAPPTRGGDRRGGGDAARIVEHATHVMRGATPPVAAGSGRWPPAAARRGRCVKPSTRRRPATLRTRPSRQPRQLLRPGAPDGSARSVVVAGLQLRRVGDRQRHAPMTAPLASRALRHRRQRRGAPTREERRAGATGLQQVEAERLLLVHARRPALRRSGRAVARVGEVVVLEAQQAGDAAAAEQRRRAASARCRAVDDADGRARRVVLVGCATAAACAWPPSTRRWPPPTNTLSVPSSAGMRGHLTMLAMISATSRSRWSSRSLGVWPLPCAAAICALTLRDLGGERVDRRPPSRRVLRHAGLQRRRAGSPASAKRAARSSARASTTCRAARSCGRLATSTNALSSSPAAWPRPASPVSNTCSRRCSCRSRAASAAASRLGRRPPRA